MAAGSIRPISGVSNSGSIHMARSTTARHVDRSTVGRAGALHKKNKNGRLSPANRLLTDKTNTQGLNFTFHLLTSNKSNIFHIVTYCILIIFTAILINNNNNAM